MLKDGRKVAAARGPSYVGMTEKGRRSSRALRLAEKEAAQMRKFTVVLTADLESGGYTATVPALPGCVSDGETIDDALARVQDAITLYLRNEEEPRSLDSAVGPQVVVAEVMVA